jgi:sulfate adenylyltransferase
MIKAHGGRLISRIANDAEQERWRAELPNLKHVTVNARELSDVAMIATGAMSPLEGFMERRDYEHVCEHGRLANGLPWTIPITLAVSSEMIAAENISIDDTVALQGEDGTVYAIMEIADIYKVDKDHEAQSVLKTTDTAHPGVAYLQKTGDTCLGGRITMLQRPANIEFEDFRLDPRETRFLFKEKGWDTIAAFQTRNPIHRAHEYLQKCALELVDALLIHPIMGETKSDDIPADVRLECYNALLKGYYPAGRVAMSILPAAMRYAGPREAVFHAIVRKNYGCTHFIVGRDHAGVGGYYGTYDAHHIFKEFEALEIGITPLFFDHAFFCNSCNNMASQKTCPHDSDQHVFLSGTRIRDMLSNGESLPAEFTRPEISEILQRHYSNETTSVSS